MTAIPDEAKVELDQYFEEGIHEVKIQGITLEDEGTERFEVGVKGKNGEQATVRMYLTEKAMKYTIDNLRKIVVHNTPDKLKKDAARDEVNACKTTEELLGLLQKKLENADCWYSKFKNGQQYQAVDKDGTEVTRDSYDTRLSSFEPTPPKNVVTAQKAAAVVGGGEITKDNLGEFPFK